MKNNWKLVLIIGAGVVAVILLFLAIWLSKCLDAFVHAEELFKHEQWEEDKMMDCSTHA